MKGYRINNKDNWVDLLASKIAEVRLSELGYNFIPGIAPLFKRVKRFIETKGYIVKRNSIID